jgi:uncharacterized protein YgiM (DUF1202 family)
MAQRGRRVTAAVAITIACVSTGRATPASAQRANKSSLPSLFCDFVAPYKLVVLSPEGVLVEVDHEDGHAFELLQPTSVSGSINNRMSVTLPGSNGTLVVNRVSGELSSHYAELNIFSGGCEQLPTGFILRQVVGVADNDRLNIRKAPTASAQVIATRSNGNLIWVRPSKSNWIAIAYTEGAPSKTRTGWVRKTFVSKTRPKFAHPSTE